MSEITLLDGSIGQELVKRAGDRPTPLWSTSVMMEKPGLCQAVHEDYFARGASVATANTYAVQEDRLVRVGLEAEQLRLLDLAVSEAEAARAAHGAGRLAVALGPLGATYRPDIKVPHEAAREAYAKIVRHTEDRADLFLIETVSSVHAAEGALMGCEGTEKPVWLSLTVDDDDGAKLRSGESVADIAPLVDRYAPDAVLLNCSRPEAMGAGLELLREMGKPFGAYANGFTRISAGFLAEFPTVDALEARHDLTPEQYAYFAMDWVTMGARIVGGCCEVGPEHISELHRQLVAAGHTIV